MTLSLSSFKINGHFFIRLYSVKSSFYRRVTGQILKNDQDLQTVFLRLFSSNEWSLGKKKKLWNKKNVIPLFIVSLLGMLLLRDKLESTELHSKSTQKALHWIHEILTKSLTSDWKWMSQLDQISFGICQGSDSNLTRLIWEIPCLNELMGKKPQLSPSAEFIKFRTPLVLSFYGSISLMSFARKTQLKGA